MIVYSKSEKRQKNYEDKKKYFSNLNKYEAIDGLNEFEKFKKIALQNNFLTNNYIKYCEKFQGKLGCNLSHILLLKEFLNKKDSDWLLVLEDDLQLNRFNEKIIELLINIAIKNNSNFIQLFTGPKFIENQKKGKMIKSSIYEMIPQWYTLAYLINKKGIETILSKLPWNDNVDIIFSNYIKELNSICFVNNIFINGGSLETVDKNSNFGSLIWKNPPK